MEVFPFCIFKVITGHPSQEVTFAVSKPFINVVLHYTETGKQAPPGLQIVMPSRLKGLEIYCIGNKIINPNKGGLKNIGNFAAHFK